MEAMNDGKEGKPFRYPERLIKMLAFIHVFFHLPYRQTEGFMNALRRYDGALKTPDYSTIDRRTNKLKIDVDPKLDGAKPVTIAVDSSGIKVSNSGDWIREKWGADKNRRSYLKVHLAVDTRTKKIVAMDVTKEHVHDTRRFKRLVKQSREKANVKKVVADGAYDTKENFEFCSQNGVEPIIKVRKGSVPKARGSWARRYSVEEQLSDYNLWKERHGYGYRWSVEGAFSVIKRVFGEYVSAKKYPNMVKEIMLKVSLYNIFTGMSYAS